MSRDVTSEQQNNIRFVKAIEKHPSLYNFHLPHYGRRDTSDIAWAEVGKEVNMTPSSCRERWRNLRAVFVRTIRKPRKNGGKKKPYYLSEAMQFVKPYMRPFRETSTENNGPTRKVESSDTDSISDQDISDDNLTLDDGDQIENAPQASTSKAMFNTDPVRSFLDSLVPELIEMNSVQFKKFKRKVLLLIDDITDDTAKPRKIKHVDHEYFL